MKSAWTLVACLVLGAGLGWFLRDATWAPAPPAPEAFEVVRADGPAARTRPTLQGADLPPAEVSVPAPAPVPGAPTDSDREVEMLLVDGEILEVIDLEGEWDPWAEELAEAHRGWHALLTLYALAGRLDDFLRIAAQALDAGFDPGTLLELVPMLPKDQQVAALNAFLAQYPDLHWGVAALADIFTAAGAPERAVDVLTPVLAESADVDLAQRLVAADPERAAAMMAGWMASEDWTADMLGQVGGSFMGAGRPDLALPLLQQALDREPTNHGVLMSLNEVDPALALAHARDLTHRFSDRSDVWGWLGKLEADAGNPEAAFAAWRTAAEGSLSTEAIYGMMGVDPEKAYEVASALAQDETGDEVLGAVAKVALRSGHPEDVRDAVYRAHRQDPTDWEWMRALVALDPAWAAEVLDGTIDSYDGGSSHDELLGARGNALLGMGDADGAFESYREAFELDPSDWEWQRGLARADPEAAIPLLEARLDDGSDGDLVGAVADAYAGAGRRDEAIAMYERAIDDGGGTEWYARLGLLEPDRAIAALEAHLRSAPDSGEAWGALGDLHRDLGDTDAAHAAYEQARHHAGRSLVHDIRYSQTGEEDARDG